jgi:hypothetical protein
MNQSDQDPTEVAETEAPERPPRQGRGLVTVQNPYGSKGGGEKPEPPRIINTTYTPPESEPPKPLKDTPAIAEKRKELARLELELKLADRERQALVRQLGQIQHEIDVKVGHLNWTAASISLVENKKDLRSRFVMLFKKSQYGQLDPHDAQDFARVGVILANQEFLSKYLRAEAADIDEALATLEKQGDELREKLGPDAETEEKGS